MTTDMVYKLLVRIQNDTSDMRRRLGGLEKGQETLREEFEVFRDETVAHFERLETTMAEQLTLLVDGQQQIFGLLHASQAERCDMRRRIARLEGERFE